MLTTTQAAKKLNVSGRRVLAMIEKGRLKAMKLGRDWFIEERDLAAVKVRKPGRPAKPAKKGGAK